jgi:KDEL-tailed cysteine endopeptidase
MRTFYLASVLAAAVLASGHEFSVCKGQTDLLSVTSLEFNPEPPRAGKDLTVHVKGTSQVEISAGTKLKVDIKVFGVVVNSQVMEICDLVACPLPALAPFDVYVTQPIPIETPVGMTATVKITVSSASGQALSCLLSQVEISSHNEEQELLGATSKVEFLFQKWKLQFPHASHHFEHFAENWKFIVNHNVKANPSFLMAMNEFGSMTWEEFSTTRMGLKTSTRPSFFGQVPRVSLRSAVEMADPPAEVDWTSKGVVARVKNQGSCGSCWAFSAIGSVESAFAIKTGQLVEFSEQELVSCDPVDSGCQGGLMDNAFTWIQQNTLGLCTEEAYPYTSGTTSASGACLKTSCDPVAGSVPSSFVDIPHNEASLQAAIALHGPVSVAIEADQSAFQFYHSGVLTGACGNKLDHGVLLVGYGVDADSKLKYWKVKNSWGAGWGEEGYIRILRGKRWPSSECGIASAASYPVFGT